MGTVQVWRRNRGKDRKRHIVSSLSKDSKQNGTKFERSHDYEPPARRTTSASPGPGDGLRHPGLPTARCSPEIHSTLVSSGKLSPEYLTASCKNKPHSCTSAAFGFCVLEMATCYGTSFDRSPCSIQPNHLANCTFIPGPSFSSGSCTSQRTSAWAPNRCFMILSVEPPKVSDSGKGLVAEITILSSGNPFGGLVTSYGNLVQKRR